MLALLSACSIIPNDGPSTRRMESAGLADSDRPIGNYTLLPLTADLAGNLQHATASRPAGARQSFPAARPLGLIGPGDKLQITLWEPNPTSGSLFERAGMNVTVRVETDGTIAVPYAGRIPVGGRSAAQAEAAILARMKSQSASIQVTVLTLEDVTNGVIVQGEVAHPGRVVLTPGAGNLLDALALAGGSRLPGHLAVVRLTRGSTTVTRDLNSVSAGSPDDVALAPGDRIEVAPVGKHFYAFGAVNRPGEQPYASGEMSLGQSLGRMSGLQDNRANPEAVFVFRRQPAELTRTLLANPDSATTDLTQVVYRLNMADPNSFFVAQNFQVAPNDVVFVSQIVVSEMNKFLSILVNLSGAAAVPRNFTPVGGF